MRVDSVVEETRTSSFRTAMWVGSVGLTWK